MYSKGFSGRLSLSVAGFLALAAAAADPRYFIVLTGEPLAPSNPSSLRPASPAAATRLLQLNREQDAMAAVVQARGGKVLERYQLLNHALFVELPAVQAAALRGQPGVAAVVPEQHHQRHLVSSVPFSGATRVWAGSTGIASATGKGVRIGIIDSGIDYHHAMFGGAGTVAAYNADDPTRIEPGSFPTTKVVGGTDFVGDDYDSTGFSGSSTPQPDPDPLDPSANGHGSHVSGIAAGFGVLANGTTFHGPYTTALDPKKFKIGPGMAPEAVLYALKVFGVGGSTSSSMIVKALNWAADPNADGDTSDHLDVVNLSLGSSFADDSPGDPERDAVDRLVKLGCVVTISAGNGGDTAYKVGNPGAAPRALTVANSIDDGFKTGALRVEAPAAIAGAYAMVEGEFTQPLAGLSPIRARVVVVNPLLGCDPFINAAAVSGKIALIDRGTCFFVDKVRNAQEAGAIGVITVNNVEGPPFVMGGSGDTSDITIPGVMISLSDGAILKAQATHGLEVTLSADVVLTTPQLADTVDSSSSRGPVWRHSELKPDLAAPGASIVSTSAGSGSDGVAETGTSMSSPHAAGAAALVKQVHPNWAAEEIKAVLMNTAVTPMHSLSGASYSESRVGAGRLAVDRAVRSPVTVRAENDGGAVSLSFGEILVSSPSIRTGAFILANHSDTPLTYHVVASNTLDNPGVRLVPAVSDVVVPAQGTARVAVQLNITPSLLKADADDSSDNTLVGAPRFALPEGTGQLWFLGGPVDLHVPWYSVPRALSAQLAAVHSQGTPPGDRVTVRMPTRGTNGHVRPLVGVFQLGVTSSAAHFGDFRDATDVIATGAASDYVTAGSLDATRVFFALVTAGAWPTPQRYFQDLEIEVDLDGDGVADVVLANSNEGSTDGDDLEDYESANDALLTAVDSRDGSPLEQGGVWNGLAPSEADTAPFQNAMMVHSATGAQLHLTVASPGFRYRVITQGDFSDTSTWARFDPTKPVVDSTGLGIHHTPWLDEGSKVSTILSRPNAVAAAIDPNGQVSVLLVHAHGKPGSQADIVRLNLGSADLDGDGLPDDWELAFLGDLDDTATSDRDGDGFTAAQEFAAGTDPSDPQSRLVLIPPVNSGDAISWQSVLGRHYTVLRGDVLTGPLAVWRSGIIAGGPTTTVTDPDLAARDHTHFYRVRLEP